MLVAATGGHLMQLSRLRDRIETLGDPLWVTFDAPQSRSLLAGEDVSYVRLTAPRDYASVARNLRAARDMLRRHNVVEVISTGSAVALSFLPVARLAGIPCHYIESAARSEGPSLTGKLLQGIQGVELYTQYRAWQSSRWHSQGSVFDEFDSAPPQTVDAERLEVVVSLGTLDYRFDRLIDAVRFAARPGWKITWQVGANDYGSLPGRVCSLIDADEFATACRRADLVISHAGVGSALTALEAGHQPVLVPRVASHSEHIDDHQRWIAHELSDRGLATQLTPERIHAAGLVAAARRRARWTPQASSFSLRR